MSMPAFCPETFSPSACLLYTSFQKFHGSLDFCLIFLFHHYHACALLYRVFLTVLKARALKSLHLDRICIFIVQRHLIREKCRSRRGTYKCQYIPRLDIITPKLAGGSKVAIDKRHIVIVPKLTDYVFKMCIRDRFLIMVKAGKPVDMVIEQLLPLIDEGDMILDGGNSFFEDTRRREKSLREKGILYFGTGVSGGEKGARFGPSIMPGGDKEAYGHIAPLLEAIAANAQGEPCCAYMLSIIHI